MWQRVDIARHDSDAALFQYLLYTGEMVVKLATAALVACIDDDRDRTRYRLIHRIIRADGLGEWARAASECLTGPATQYILPDAHGNRTELTQRHSAGSWQYDSVAALHGLLRLARANPDALSNRIAAQEWFHLFVQIRNHRSHGAMGISEFSALSAGLEASIRQFSTHLQLLQRPWAYLYRNLSGRYRVVPLAGDPACYSTLTTAEAARLAPGQAYKDGVYICIDKPRRVDLLECPTDVSDYFFPNGNFNNRRYELLSYITDERFHADAAQYLADPGHLPSSETEGLRELDLVGDTFSNVPPVPTGYVNRKELEDHLRDLLTDDRHPVLTLVGRGGIGKTSLALSVLHEIAKLSQYFIIAWFSARDIDLLTSGPKVVTPKVLTHEEIAAQFHELIRPSDVGNSTADKIEYLSRCLQTTPHNAPILFVFDNFETVRNPIDLYAWLDGRIRLPNKILITTRHRQFKADYPIDVQGMSQDEANELITNVSQRLGITSFIDENYRQAIFNESDGHPYIIKVLLGEVAKARKAVKIERLVAGRDEVLDALFERTYANLSPAARRVFLTLCNWRSLIPIIGLQAVLLRPGGDEMDVSRAVDDLVQFSFAETVDGDDGYSYISVPLVASVFGRRKLDVSPLRPAIKADTEILQVFGATQASGLRHGMYIRIRRLFEFCAAQVSRDPASAEVHVPMLELVCRQFPPAWLLLADFYEQCGIANGLRLAQDAVTKLLERTDDGNLQTQGWERLLGLARRTRDRVMEINALVGMSKVAGMDFRTISRAVNQFNSLLREERFVLDSDEKRIVVKELADIMASRSEEADATDLSRLAWLFLHMKDTNSAGLWVQRGLQLDPQNIHCLGLAQRLGINASNETDA